MKLLIRAALLAASIGSIGNAYAGNVKVPPQSDRAFAATQSGSAATRPVTHLYAASTLAWDQNRGAEG
jgi:hypothetical protein